MKHWGFSALAICTLTSTAGAVIRDRTVTFTIFAVPTDPTSTPLFSVQLDLDVSIVAHNKDDNGGTILWDIDRVLITDLDTGHAWSKLDAGTWSTVHADLGAIAASEFAAPPALASIASALDAGVDDLDFALAGRIYPGPECHAPATAGLDYDFWPVGGSQRLGTGTIEPVEVDQEEDL